MTTPPPDPDLDRARANLLSALAALPRHRGLSFRGRTESLGLYYPGRTIVTGGLTASTLDLMVATRNREVGQVFAIIGTAGALLGDLSAAPQEREVVFLPSTVFVVGPTETVGSLEVTYVDQVDLDRPAGSPRPTTLEQVRERTASLVARYEQSAPVPTVNPDKFLGPLA